MTSSNGNFLPRYWPFERGIHRWTVKSTHKGQWRGALMNEHWWGRWLETPSCSLWRHCNVMPIFLVENKWRYWPALRAGLLCCNFFGQPGSVSKFPPFVWVKLWVGWVGRGYTEISRYFPASWINWVTLVTKIKLLYSLRFEITFESPKMPLWYDFFASQSLILCAVYHSSPSSHVRFSLIGWLFILGYTDCNTVPTWWM